MVNDVEGGTESLLNRSLGETVRAFVFAALRADKSVNILKSPKLAPFSKAPRSPMVSWYATFAGCDVRLGLDMFADGDIEVPEPPIVISLRFTVCLF